MYIWLVQIVSNCQSQSYPLVLSLSWQSSLGSRGCHILHFCVSLLQNPSSFRLFSLFNSFLVACLSLLHQATKLKLHPGILCFRQSLLNSHLDISLVGSLLQGRWCCIFCLREVVTPAIWLLSICNIEYWTLSRSLVVQMLHSYRHSSTLTPSSAFWLTV